MKDEADRASETSRRVASLDDSLDLRGQLINIRKRIELTRSKANLVGLYVIRLRNVSPPFRYLDIL